LEGAKNIYLQKKPIRIIVRPIITTNTDDHIGLAVVRSLGKNNIDFQIVSNTKNTLAWYSRYCNNKIIGRYDLDFFSKLSKEDVIFPMLEDTMLLLAKHKLKLQCQMGFSDYETLQIAADKSLLVQHAIEHKIPCPKTFFITKPEDIQECASTIDFPTILKPSRGASGKGILSVDFPALLPAIAYEYFGKDGPFLLQEKIPYDERYSVAILMNYDHKLRRCCVLRVIRAFPMETGPSTFVISVERPDLVKLGELLLESIGFYGIAEIEFVIDKRDNSPKLMEINPRFWGSLQGAINAGVDFPNLLNTMIRDGDIEKSLSYKTGIRCRYILYTDLMRLITLMQSDYPAGYKRKALRDFFIIPKDEGYYVYSHDDILPFFGLTYIKLLRKLGLEKKDRV
jgi:predicted ATP-grasp superfamily ATP-dependent carboligase